MATKTLIALFDNRSRADDAAQGLKAEGFSSSDIHTKAYAEYSGHVHEEQESPLRSFLRDIGLIESKPERRVSRTDETVVMLDVDDAYVDDAAEILNRHGAMNLDERMAGYQPSGETTEARGAEQGKIEEVEEELQIGTRPVSRGGVRVYSRPTEREVEKTVSLQEEEVHVERKPVDRPASEGEARGAFQEESFEVRAEGEEPVVCKEARVKEEVSQRSLSSTERLSAKPCGAPRWRRRS